MISEGSRYTKDWSNDAGIWFDKLNLNIY